MEQVIEVKWAGVQNDLLVNQPGLMTVITTGKENMMINSKYDICELQ